MNYLNTLTSIVVIAVFVVLRLKGHYKYKLDIISDSDRVATLKDCLALVNHQKKYDDFNQSVNFSIIFAFFLISKNDLKYMIIYTIILVCLYLINVIIDFRMHRYLTREMVLDSLRKENKEKLTKDKK